MELFDLTAGIHGICLMASEGSMIKLWCQDYGEDFYTDAGLQNARRFIGVPLAACRSLIGLFPEDVRVVLRSDGDPADFFMAGPIPVVSPKLKAVLDIIEARVELFPVKIIGSRGGQQASDWYCLNILTEVDCFDWKNSKFTPENGFATNIERVSLVEQVIGLQPLFRVHNTIPSLVASTEPLADAVIQAGCSGVVFKTPAEWQNPMNPIY